MDYALKALHDDPLGILKDQTWPLHKALEKRLAFPDSFVSKTEYSKVLMLFYIFQRQLAFSTRIYESQVPHQFSLSLRNRLPLVEQDINRLAIPPPVGIRSDHSLQLQSLDEFYGCLYVSEGSTLGGNIIQRTMLKTHGEIALEWTNYLNPYGQQMLPMWQSFCFALLKELDSGTVTIGGLIDGAQKAFQYMLDIASQLGFTEK